MLRRSHGRWTGIASAAPVARSTDWHGFRCAGRTVKGREPLQHLTDRSYRLLDAEWPAMLLDRAGIHPSLARKIGRREKSFFVARPLAMCPTHIDTGSASKKCGASRTLRHTSKGTMPPHRRQHGGALGRPAAHGTIRSTPERRPRCCDQRTDAGAVSTLLKPARRRHISRSQMLRKLIGGLGSPCDCSRMGSAPCALYSGAPMYFVSPLSCT